MRLGILLLVLAICIVALCLDYFVFKPGSEAASEKIRVLVEARNKMSVKEGGPVTREDIQKEIGRSPTWVEEEPLHTVEWYCWWGPTPLLSTRRHYITVLYIGENRRFNSQQLNGPPAEEDLPGYVPPQSDVAPLGTPDATPSGDPGIAAEGVPPGMPGGAPPGGGGKGKGKGKGNGKGKRGSDEPLEGSPNQPPPHEDSPAQTTADPAAPMEKPAAEGDKPVEREVTPASDKPVEQPAGEQPESNKPTPDQPAEAGAAPGDE